MALALALALAVAGTGCVPTAQPLARPPREAPAAPSPVMRAATPEPTPVPAGYGVALYYEDNAQVELISPGGVRVLIDVYDPARLSSPATEQDVLLTTQDSPDHLDAAFIASFPGQRLTRTAGSLEAGGIAVHGIASARKAGDAVDPQDPANVIFVVDIGGLRIAHFGDTGQDALTPAQLDALGKVDVAITQLSNPESDIDHVNRRGFLLMQQVGPRLVIPTHDSMMAARYANDLWRCVHVPHPFVVVTPAKLDGEVHCLLLGQTGGAFQQMLKLPVAEW